MRAAEGAVEQETIPGFAARHYSPAELGELWGLSSDSIRRLFENEPGVLMIEPPRGRFSRRRYRTLRIPVAVVERVHRRMSVVTNGTKE